MTAAKTHAAPSCSRASSPNIDELLEDLKSSVSVPPAYPNDTVYDPRTTCILPAPSTLDIDPEMHFWVGQITPTEVAKLKDPLALEAIKRPLPPVDFTMLTKAKGHPQGFDTSRSPCIDWDADKPLDTANQEFVVESGTPFGVEGYKDICSLAQKRKAAEEDVGDTRKKQRADKSSRSRSPDASAPSPAVKRATPKADTQKSTVKSATRKRTPTPASTAVSKQMTPRPQTSQKTAAAGPSARIPVRQTRWTTRAENSLMNMKEA